MCKKKYIYIIDFCVCVGRGENTPLTPRPPLKLPVQAYSLFPTFIFEQ